MKKALTFGVYDLLHIGHVLLFKRAKLLPELGGGELIVAVQDSDYILKYKPGSTVVNDTSTRMFMVDAIKYVDKVVTYKDVDKDIQNIDFDIFVKGPDQNHDGFKRAEQWCREHGKEVVVIPRTSGISSSMLRSIMNLK